MKSNDSLDNKPDDEMLVNDSTEIIKLKKVIKKKKTEEYAEEKLNVSLYYEISSTIYNSLSNLIITKAIINDEHLLKILELQILNLFFLEGEVKELKSKKYAKEFLQIVSNLMNRSLTIKKIAAKNRIEMLEERNLLIVSIINICKNVERESLERIRQFDDESFSKLDDQILALNNFSNDSPEIKTVTPLFASDNNVTTAPIINSQTNNAPINNLDPNSLANLTKLGILPQHPATNPKFYPYVSKPKYIPPLKKVLAAFLLLVAILVLSSHLLTYFITGNYAIVSGETKKYLYNFGRNSQTNFLSIIIIIGVNAGFIYSILKPAKLGRDTYRTSYFLLVIIMLWLVYQISNIWLMITDDALTKSFSNCLVTVGKDKELNPTTLTWLKSLATFKAFEILVYITTFLTVLPFAVVLVIAILNPKIDRNKLIKANSEYQNAITNALNGKPYEMDPTLFDDTLDQDNKGKNSHKFWSNSDLFK